MAELVTLIVEALIEFVSLLIKAVTTAVTVIAYACSRQFREKKRTQWAVSPLQKYWELGASSLCLVGIVALLVWILHDRNGGSPGSEIVQDVTREEPVETEDARLKVTTKKAGNSTNHLTVTVEKGGLKKISGTSTLEELGTALKENVTVTRLGTNMASSVK